MQACYSKILAPGIANVKSILLVIRAAAEKPSHEERLRVNLASPFESEKSPDGTPLGNRG